MRVDDTLGVCNSKGVADALPRQANKPGPNSQCQTRMRFSNSGGDATV